MTIPIPHRPSGVIAGNPSAAVTIDVFLDIQCPHSKQAWPTIMNLIDEFQETICLRTHLLTLSDHRQAWDVSLGIFALSDGDAGKFYGFVSYLYEQQSRFSNAAFRFKTHDELQNLIAELAHEYAEVDKATFLERMNAHDIYIMGRTPIRYAATRSVWATPTFFINNAGDISVNHRSGIEDWRTVLQPLL